MSRAKSSYWLFVLSSCADCGVGTFGIGEYYMVKDEIWEQAAITGQGLPCGTVNLRNAGRRKDWHSLDGQEMLCIGCLEKRIGRTLMRCDFTDAPINTD